MAINLTGMFQNLGGATDALSKSIMGSPVPTDPMQRNAMQRMGVTNPMLQQFGQGLGSALGQEMRSGNDLVKAAMTSIDIEDPNALAKVADKIKNIDPATAMKLLITQKDLDQKRAALDVDKIKAALTAGKEKGYSTTEGPIMKDSKGNMYQLINKGNKDIGSVSIEYLPLGNSPEYDGKAPLRIVPQSGNFAGLDPFEGSDLKIQTATEEEKIKAYNEQRFEATTKMIDALDQQETLSELVGLIDKANAEGDLQGGLDGAIKQKFYDITGKMPATLAELNTAFGQVTYSYLRELFGSQITEGERKAVEDIFLGIEKSGTVNKAVLNRLLKAGNNAIAKYTLYKENPTYQDFNRALEDVMSTKIKEINARLNPPKPETGGQVKTYNPTTGKFE